MLVVVLNNRRHRVAEARLRSASLDSARPADDASHDRFPRGA